MGHAELSYGLAETVDDIAEVSAYIWESGWSAANGGNLTVDVTGLVQPGDFEACDVPLLPLGVAAPAMAGRSLFVTVSGSRFRDVPKAPGKALILLQVSDSGDRYRVLWGGEGGGKPTMEFIPHLKAHAYLLAAGRPQPVVLHTHPVHLIAATHLPEYGTPAFDRVLEVSLSTARVFLPAGVGMVGAMPMGSEALADATVEALAGRKAVLWQRHGCVAVGADVFEAFDTTDMLEKAAQMFLVCLSSGCLPGWPGPDGAPA